MWFLQLFTLDKNLFIKLIDNKGEVYTGDEVDDDDDEISVKSKQGDNSTGQCSFQFSFCLLQMSRTKPSAALSEPGQGLVSTSKTILAGWVWGWGLGLGGGCGVGVGASTFKTILGSFQFKIQLQMALL